tara:strand:- start:2182 stop:4710 length:2529 start_codon:yes stop_codon:yes gene_type:complete
MYQSIFIDRNKRKVHLWDDKEGYLIESLHPYMYGYVKDARGAKKAIDNKWVRKIKVTEQVKQAARHPETQNLYYETDVPLETRVLIDKYGDTDEPSTGHRELNFDIETEILHGFPDWQNPINKITAIAWHEKLSDEYCVLVLDEDDRVEGSVNGNVEIVSFATEQGLLETFIERFREIAPHIITGWNIEGFDVPYLLNRISYVLGSGAERALSPVGVINYREGIEKWFIEGISILDYMLLYKKFTMGERPSYRLDAIGKYEVDLGKIEYEGNLDDLFESDINKYIEYNLNDVEIVKKLDDKLKFIDLCRTICHKGHIPYQQIHITSAYQEGAILTHTRRLDIVTQNKPYNVVKESKFSGAYVKIPEPGRYEWIYDLDLTSLYPSIIMTLNISPETKLGVIDDFDTADYRVRKQRDWTLHANGKYRKLSTTELDEMLAEEQCSLASNGAIYRTERSGLIPSILDRWFKERVEYKNLRKKYEKEGDEAKAAYFDQLQYTTKILLNSMYGVLGNKTFRFFDIDNAEAVTLTGQQLIKATGEFGSKFYNDELGTDNIDYCIYTDTDSVFFSAKPIIEKRYPNIDHDDKVAMTEAILPVAEEVQEFINRMYDLYATRIHNVSTHRFDIKQELISKAGIWIAKKRYAQWVINQEGHPVDKLDVKGIDVVRSNFPTAMRKFLADVLQSILENKTQHTLDEMVLDFKEDMKSMDIGDIAKSTGVKDIEKHIFKDEGIIELSKGAPAHVKAAAAYNNMLRRTNNTQLGEIRSGDKIKWVYLRNNKFGLGAIAFKNYDDPDEILEFIKKYINYEMIFTRELHNKLEAFYSAMKWGEVPTQSMRQVNKFFDFS